MKVSEAAQEREFRLLIRTLACLVRLAVLTTSASSRIRSTGMFINYEISPLLVSHTETRQAFAHFVTSYVTLILSFLA